MAKKKTAKQKAKSKNQKAAKAARTPKQKAADKAARARRSTARKKAARKEPRRPSKKDAQAAQARRAEAAQGEEIPVVMSEAITCPTCGSTRRKRYHRTARQIWYGRSPITGVECCAILRQWTFCANCGQVRIEKTYVAANQGDQDAEDMAIANASAARATANGVDVEAAKAADLAALDELNETADAQGDDADDKAATGDQDAAEDPQGDPQGGQDGEKKDSTA